MNATISKKRAPVVTQILTVEETRIVLLQDTNNDIDMIYIRQSGSLPPFHVFYRSKLAFGWVENAVIRQQIYEEDRLLLGTLINDPTPLMDALSGGFEVCFVGTQGTSFRDSYYRVVGDKCLRIYVDSDYICENWEPENDIGTLTYGILDIRKNTPIVKKVEPVRVPRTKRQRIDTEEDDQMR